MTRGATWQTAMLDELRTRLDDRGAVEATGSVADPVAELDGWSDLDVRITLPTEPHEGNTALDLLAGWGVWAFSDVRSDDHQVLRTVLRDGRWVDLSVYGGVVEPPPAAVDNDIRFVAAVAATKLGRGDQLIGLHLALELLRSCLVLAMQLRDRDRGTTVHRFGSDRDALAVEVAELAGGEIAVLPRPNIVERTVDLYGRWRRRLEPGYVPDWSGLSAVLDRGLSLPMS